MGESPSLALSGFLRERPLQSHPPSLKQEPSPPEAVLTMMPIMVP